jgi:cytochrome c biogenesis protein CcdA/thiol-disulfide isomerase/thioredoxin
MRSRLLLIAALALLLSLAFVSCLADPGGSTSSTSTADRGAQSAFLDTSELGSDANGSITVYFFYGSGCSHCALVEPYMDSIAAKYPQATVKKMEVYYNSTNQALFQDLNARYDVEDPVVPSVFIGDKALIGEDAINAELEPTIQRMIEAGGANDAGGANASSDANGTNGTDGSNANDSSDTPGPNDGGTAPSADLTVLMVVVAALTDSINPCAISVMIFLLVFLTRLGDRGKVLRVGAVYIATVYLVYFSAGLGILAFLQSSAITRSVYYVAAVLSIAIGLINIKDFFFPSKKPTLAIPESRKPLIKRYIEKASIPAAVVLGLIVSLFELPCTGGIYFAILSLLGNEMTMAEGVPYLALYNAMYVLPLAVILVVIFMGVSAERANSWRLENRRSLRLIVGVVMLLLGAIMLFEAS